MIGRGDIVQPGYDSLDWERYCEEEAILRRMRRTHCGDCGNRRPCPCDEAVIRMSPEERATAIGAERRYQEALTRLGIPF